MSRINRIKAHISYETGYRETVYSFRKYGFIPYFAKWCYMGNEPRNPLEEGAREALVKLGFLKKSGFLWWRKYRLTNKTCYHRRIGTDGNYYAI